MIGFLFPIWQKIIGLGSRIWEILIAFGAGIIAILWIIAKAKKAGRNEIILDINHQFEKTRIDMNKAEQNSPKDKEDVVNQMRHNRF